MSPPLCLSPLRPLAAGDRVPRPDLLAVSRPGGFVVYFRHARTDRFGTIVRG